MFKKRKKAYPRLPSEVNFPHINMITLINKNFNKNTNEYFKYVDSHDFSVYSCPSCHSTCSLIKHGFYKRNTKINNKIKNLYVLRLKCKHCGKTHAVLPSFVVPYLLTSVDDAVMIINDLFDISKCYSTKRLLKQIFSNWIHRLLSLFKCIGQAFHDLHALMIRCSLSFNLAFLQNHRGKYFCF